MISGLPETINYLGRVHAVHVDRTPLPLSRIIEREGTVKVQIPASVAVSQLVIHVRERLEGWLRSQARRVLEERVSLLSQKLGYSVKRIAIKDTKTRWGSCSRKGNVNFNWRLIMAPLPVVDYLVIHELSHLGEMNHSDRFWALVARHCPDYRSHVAWLKACGEKLLRF